MTGGAGSFKPDGPEKLLMCQPMRAPPPGFRRSCASSRWMDVLILLFRLSRNQVIGRSIPGIVDSDGEQQQGCTRNGEQRPVKVGAFIDGGSCNHAVCNEG